jgi:phage-related protein
MISKKEICGYKVKKLKNVLTWIFMILTLGLLRLIFYWKPDWYLKATCAKCSLEEATQILLKVTLKLILYFFK